MGGLAFFSLIGLYFFIAYKIVKAIKSKYRKWLAIAILALIPTADAVVGRIYLQHLCSTENGLKVYRVAQGVEGFMLSGGGGDGDMYVEKYGYKFTESTPVDGLVNRYSKQDGKVVKENRVIPQSNFQVRFLRAGEKDAYTRTMVSVETFPAGEILGADVQIGFNGGWAERFLARFSDGGAGVVWCEYKDLIVRNRGIILGTLKR